MLKAGDKVDYLQPQRDNWGRLKLGASVWVTGWTIEFIHKGWALIEKIEKTQLTFRDPETAMQLRRKVRTDFLRVSTTAPTVDPYNYDCPLPDVGTGVMFSVPHTLNEWTFGIVTKKNKKTIQVLHNGKFITRGPRYFIEVADGV
tara:strand:- start:129 stop:563 length:435 start_codon:yes stop_codon:yes gene_type:complete